MINARVARRGLGSNRWRIGRRNAAVLPLPVAAVARRSRPSRAAGIASFWIGVGREKPISRTPFKTSGWSPKPEKAMELTSFRGALPRHYPALSRGEREGSPADRRYRRAEAGAGEPQAC